MKFSLALLALLTGCASTPTRSPSFWLATWNKSPGATGYLVCTNGATFARTATNGFLFSPLPAGTLLSVKATNATQVGLPSNVLKL